VANGQDSSAWVWSRVGPNSAARAMPTGYVYDPDVLADVPMEQPILEAGSVTIPGTVAVNGPLTDAELRSAEVPVVSTTAGRASRVDEVDATTTYIGSAVAGSATSGAVWAVQRLTTSGADLTVEWADGDAETNNVWDNRASLSYS